MAFSLMSYAPIAIAVKDKHPVDVQELFTSTSQFIKSHLYILKLTENCVFIKLMFNNVDDMSI